MNAKTPSPEVTSRQACPLVDEQIWQRDVTCCSGASSVLKFSNVMDDNKLLMKQDMTEYSFQKNLTSHCREEKKSDTGFLWLAHHLLGANWALGMQHVNAHKSCSCSPVHPTSPGSSLHSSFGQFILADGHEKLKNGLKRFSMMLRLLQKVERAKRLQINYSSGSISGVRPSCLLEINKKRISYLAHKLVFFVRSALKRPWMWKLCSCGQQR